MLGFQVMPGFSLQTSHECSCSHPLQLVTQTTPTH